MEPELGVANEPMNVQMILPKKLEKDHNPFFRNFECQAHFLPRSRWLHHATFCGRGW